MTAERHIAEPRYLSRAVRIILQPSTRHETRRVNADVATQSLSLAYQNTRYTTDRAKSKMEFANGVKDVVDPEVRAYVSSLVTAVSKVMSCEQHCLTLVAAWRKWCGRERALRAR